MAEMNTLRLYELPTFTNCKVYSSQTELQRRGETHAVYPVEESSQSSQNIHVQPTNPGTDEAFQKRLAIRNLTANKAASISADNEVVRNNFDENSFKVCPRKRKRNLNHLRIVDISMNQLHSNDRQSLTERSLATTPSRVLKNYKMSPQSISK